MERECDDCGVRLEERLMYRFIKHDQDIWRCEACLEELLQHKRLEEELERNRKLPDVTEGPPLPPKG